MLFVYDVLWELSNRVAGVSTPFTSKAIELRTPEITAKIVRIHRGKKRLYSSAQFSQDF